MNHQKELGSNLFLLGNTITCIVDDAATLAHAVVDRVRVMEFPIEALVVVKGEIRGALIIVIKVDLRGAIVRGFGHIPHKPVSEHAILFKRKRVA